MFSSLTFLFPNIVLVLVYILITFEKLPRVVVALLGASILIAGKSLTQEEAFRYIDFNVIFLLVGMMILVNILKGTGGIRWLALYTAKKVGGSGVLLMIYFAVLTAFISAFLDNVTTVLLLGAVTIAIAQDLKINPVPYLITQAIASNIGGTATLIGDPPNIMIGSAAKLDFNQFIFHLTPVILMILPVVILTLYLIYRKQLDIPNTAKKELELMSLKGIITDKNLLIKSLVIISLVIVAFFFHSKLGLEAGTIALSGASVLLIFENRRHIWDDVEWTTIFFFIGLFIIVGAVEKVGTIHYLSELVFKLSKGSYEATTLAILWMSGFLSAIIDNIPYTATMIPLIKNLGSHYHDLKPLWWALSLGACLGGNGTLIGASANIVVADMANKSKHPITFLEFLKVGLIIMIESMIICSVYLWVRYL
ncbi:MAG: ArsB/NhaD family transporter [Candidatus Melainabacteria bacterium]|nr:ArsB/NhaD family transporter [Candidatus Melainabacteria bacterium]